MNRRTETAYKAQSPGKLAQHNETPDSGDLPASGRSGSRQRRPRMLRLCSESSRSYPGRPVRRAVAVLAAPCMATCRVIGQESAEAIVGAGSYHKVVW
jgi:hypothetical protein